MLRFSKILRYSKTWGTFRIRADLRVMLNHTPTTRFYSKPLRLTPSIKPAQAQEPGAVPVLRPSPPLLLHPLFPLQRGTSKHWKYIITGPIKSLFLVQESSLLHFLKLFCVSQTWKGRSAVHPPVSKAAPFSGRTCLSLLEDARSLVRSLIINGP